VADPQSLAEFDRIISKAKAILASRSPTIKRSSLNAAEIARMAEHVYANALAWDERVRFGGRDEMERLEAEHLRLEGTHASDHGRYRTSNGRVAVCRCR
jgi:hypothetical protein